MKPSRELLRQLPNVDELLAQAEPDAMYNRYFSAPIDTGFEVAAAELESLEPATPQEERPGDLFGSNINEVRYRALEAGRSGLEKLDAQGEDAELTPAEHSGLEAIILLTHRPAILLQRGQFLEVPPEWSLLEQRREPINHVAQSVGRIEVEGHPRLDWLGTGFLVADDVIMTNRHVAEEFCHRPPRKRTWRFKPDIRGQIDYVEEFGVLQKAEFELSDVIGVHDVHDLALLRVSRTSPSGVNAPSPLTLASQPPEPVRGRKVYTCGYPASDGRRNDPEEMLRIFANIFNVKRLQPGELRQFHAGIGQVEHDCSTLGGNSGSCVVDLETDLVVGLHFGGRYLQTNKAVALWQLTEDPLLKKAGVHFA